MNGAPCALGGQASRSEPRIRRRTGLCTSSTESTDWPSRAAVSPERVTCNRRGLAASAISATIARMSAPNSATNATAGAGATAIGSTHSSAIRAARPVRTTSAGPERP